jgi:hypothetical protein
MEWQRPHDRGDEGLAPMDTVDVDLVDDAPQAETERSCPCSSQRIDREFVYGSTVHSMPVSPRVEMNVVADAG